MACVNDVPYGLAESVSTESARRHSHSLVAQPDFGTVWVNSHLAPTNEVPWGAFEGSDTAATWRSLHLKIFLGPIMYWHTRHAELLHRALYTFDAPEMPEHLRVHDGRRFQD
ncbi:aldehyde dehydrogenase-related protein [Amycolatopsis mediterranei S699]|uniref:Aldehyde dehydrogenase-related protein n=3 Tax=Amycolatopsis mediterranei TaxID=33910 RepID=A0A0H3DBY1_AMYMU|nr:aldehyde dehydrogenase-related protein [Amycolatopsis mediterranei U32]AEK44448.1 aldehyde dehydrogenase-related protein [Amycolatopsis mediterranei S699]AGT86407.1 aldehyde dehydrogenase-related protein [Amycolatopsis mediterranei RB]KDO11262.1 aldehyde dehydrogenase [Amycolatopsis mediterranei]AFO79279.1 aldehyde dehydrogenase-related protein [Amycolatopsis mediterranei S699]